MACSLSSKESEAEVRIGHRELGFFFFFFFSDITIHAGTGSGLDCFILGWSGSLRFGP